MKLKKLLSILLALCMVFSLAPAAFSNAEVTAPGTRTYTLSYDSSSGYSLNGSDGSRYTIGKPISQNITTFTAQMNDVRITVTAASGNISIIKTAYEDTSYLGFEDKDYTFSFTSSTYVIGNVKLRKITSNRVMNVDNDSKECTINWDRATYSSVQQIEVTLVASTFNVNYVLNGGTNAASNPSTYSNDQGMTLAAPTRAGYAFDGWYDNAGFNGSAITGIPAGSEGDRTFYAKWKNEIDGVNYDEENGWFVIDSAAALNALATYSANNSCSGKTFRQTADIALSGNFAGIGSGSNPFNGTYDGGGRVITGLYMKKYQNYMGFFRKTGSSAVIENVRLIQPYVSSSNSDGSSASNGTGALIGYMDHSTVRNCIVIDPEVIGNSGSTGSIVGWMYYGDVTGCSHYFSGSTLPAVGRDGGSVTATRLRKLTLPSRVSASGDSVVFSYQGVIYCGENESVTLNITPETGYIVSSLTVNGSDVTDSVSNNVYTFDMPEADVTVEISFVQETFTYVDLDGVTQTVVATRVTNNTIRMTTGWYVVDANVNCSSLALNDNINLILYDGVTLDVTGTQIDFYASSHPTLTLWGQTNGTGELRFSSISNQFTSVTVNGGKLICTDKLGYTGVVNCNLILNKGEVHLPDATNGSVTGSVTYNGGVLDVKKIAGNTTLNWTHADTDRVKASQYVGSVTVADGKYFKDTNSNFYTGTLTAEQKNAIGNVELMPSVNAHTVSINDFENGTASVDKPIAEPGDTVTLTVVPDTGYRVNNMFVNDENGGELIPMDPALGNTQSFTMPNQNVTISVEIGLADYWIDYHDLYDATFESENPTHYTVYSEDITLVNPTREGYDFLGWTGTDLDGVTTTVTIASGSTGDRLYTAHWEPHTYTVHFDANGGDGSMNDMDFTYDVSQTLTANVFTRTGYTFSGWNTEANGGGTPCSDGQSVQNLTAEDGVTVTLYAQWTPNTYTVHFESNTNLANGTMADQTFTYDQEPTALSALAFSVTIGEFLYWTTEADGTGDVYADRAEVRNLTAEDGAVITLYAQWHLMHHINYDIDVFRCYPVNDTQRPYHAYAGETVKVTIREYTHEYTITVYTEDGETVAFDTDAMTFVMPDGDVWVTYTSVKNIAYTTILLDDFETWVDAVYLYDADNPTVTPVVTVMDGETTLTEGVDYTLEITDNTGSPDRAVKATVTITGMGDYIGTNTKTFHITPFNIANCEIRGKLEAYDDGYGIYYPLTENVEVWYGETQLECNVDYEIDVEEPTSGEFEIGQTYPATVRGIGDWGGFKTFTFTVIELTHTVVFDANGGTGEMADDTVAGGRRYTLPACDFTAPAGMEFSHWVASCESDAEKRPGDYFTAPNIWSPADVQTITVTAYWKIPDGYYLIGPNWTVDAIDAGDKLGVNPGNGNEYMLSTTLAENDEIKVVHVTNNVIDAWYPDGEDTQYHVDAAHAGRVNIYFQTTYNDAWGAFGGYFYIETKADPSFATHSLVLDGKIGVNFFMDLSGLNDDEKEASYMTFAITGASPLPSDPVPFDAGNTNAKSTYYGFTCCVTSIQMADTITATFHYGDGLTVSEEYSIKQYIETFEDIESQFDETTVALVHALADYGHYVQAFLADQKSWELGENGDYAEMDQFYARNYDYDRILYLLCNDPSFDHPIKRTFRDENIVKAPYTVIFDSDTAIRVYFKPAAGFSGEVSAVLDCLHTSETYLERGSDGRYMVEIANIPAHLLGETHMILVYTDENCFNQSAGAFTQVDVSAMSYVYGILTADAYADDMYAKNGVASLYAYWRAAQAYKEAH